MGKRGLKLIVCSFFLFFSAASAGQTLPDQKAPDTKKLTPEQPNAADKPKGPPPFQKWSVNEISPKVVALGDEVTVNMAPDSPLQTDDRLAEAIKLDNVKLDQVELLFEGVTIAKGAALVEKEKALRFRLVNERESRTKIWKLDSGERHHDKKEGKVAIAFKDKEGISQQLAPQTKLTLKLYSDSRFVLSLCTAIVLLIVFSYLLNMSDIVRDRLGPAPNDPSEVKKRPYSLARCQMAFWTFIVLGSYLFLYAVLGEPAKILDPETLVLLGVVSSGTMLGAAAVEAMKENRGLTQIDASDQQITRLTAEVEGIECEIIATNSTKTSTAPNGAEQLPLLAALTRLQADKAEKTQQIESLKIEKKRWLSETKLPASKNILTDILTDSSGVSLHRFQMLAWTMAVCCVFTIEVWQSLAMPKLDLTLLALMGISSGTYLGFKIPEKQ